MKAKRAGIIQHLMRIRFDLDQLEMAKLQASLDDIEQKTAGSHQTSAKIEAAALKDGFGPAVAGQQLAAQEAARQDMERIRARTERAMEKQKALTRISFAKWNVSKRLKR